MVKLADQFYDVIHTVDKNIKLTLSHASTVAKDIKLCQRKYVLQHNKLFTICAAKFVACGAKVTVTTLSGPGCAQNSGCRVWTFPGIQYKILFIET